jgi:hypothetical protein
MLRRALFSVLPAFFALVFLVGMPAAGLGAPETAASTWGANANVAAARSLIAYRTLSPDDADGPISQSADEDDPPNDRVVRVIVTIVWPASTQAPIQPIRESIGPSHPPRAAPSRAPPKA